MGTTWHKILAFIIRSPTTTTTTTQLHENKKVLTSSKLSRGKRRWSFRKSTLQETTFLIHHNQPHSDVDVTAKQPDEVAPHHVRDSAAVSIQTAFRAYLARKALQALRGIVKLQALVRGDNVRNLTLQCRLLVHHRLLPDHRSCLSSTIYECNTEDNLAHAFYHQMWRSNTDKSFFGNQEEEAKYSISSRVYAKNCIDSPRTPSKPQQSSASPRRDRNLIAADQTPTYYHETDGSGMSRTNPNYMAATASAKARYNSQTAPSLRRYHSVMTPEREKRTSPKKRLSFPA